MATPKELCERRGGTWDAVNNKCVKKKYTGNVVDIGMGKTGTLKADGSVTPHAFRRLTSEEQGDVARAQAGRPSWQEETEDKLRKQELIRQLDADVEQGLPQVEQAEQVEQLPDERGLFTKAMDNLAAPLSQPKITFTEGWASGSRAVQASREQIAAGDKAEAWASVKRTGAATIIAGTVVATAGWAAKAIGVGGTVTATKGTAGAVAAKGSMSGVTKLLTLGLVTSTASNMVRDARQALRETETAIRDLDTELEGGHLSYLDYLQEMEELNQEVLKFERSINRYSYLSLDFYLGGGELEQARIRRVKRRMAMSLRDAPEIVRKRIEGGLE